MAFIIKKTIHRKDYYYLRESKRDGKKVKSIYLAYLGKTKRDAEKKAKEIIKEMEKEKKNVIIGEKKDIKEEKKKEKIKLGNKIDEITSIASKRGFFFQTANIYGGKAGFFTYGHLGKALKSNLEKLWKDYFLSLDSNFWEIQSNSILPKEVFKASGHLESFNDPMTECKKCNFRFRADQFLEDRGVENTGTLSIEEMTKIIKEKNLKCPKCGSELSEVKWFNMMFSLNIGFDNEKGYLSPETAQAAYITFKEEFQATRGKLPLGLAIIDKAYRNEISPRQMFFRLREFTQAELQIFFNQEKINEHDSWNEIKKKKLRIKFSDNENVEEIACDEANQDKNLPKFYLYHAAKIQDFYLKVLKIPSEKFRFRELSKEERAFYNKIHFDIEIDIETLSGFREVAGIHYRTNHDLLGHQRVSGKNLEVFDEVCKKKILPHVLELSFGVDRNIWMLLDVFYSIGREGSMFKFPPNLSPIKSAVFPIVRTDRKLVKISMEIYNELKKNWNVSYDESGSVGRRYARNDEIGTPMCITIDEQTLKSNSVTIRNRDTTKQVKVKIKDLKDVIQRAINGENLLKLGKMIHTRKK